MLERPALPDAMIVASLREHDDLLAERLTFLPYGQDVHAWLFRVDARDGQTYFLKLRRPPIDESQLALPRYLSDAGFTQIVAPLRTRAGALWRPAGAGADEYVMQLYPYIAGRPGMEGGL